MKSVKFYRKPELVNPCLVTAWPGVGNVALIAATYLKDKLKAEGLGEIDPSGFFDLGGIFVKDNLVETPKFPEGKFFYWDSEGEGKDLIIFLAEAQPAFGSYEYANMVLDVAQKFEVKRVYTLAAALTEYHPDQPRVLGAAISPELLEELRKFEVVVRRLLHRGTEWFIAGGRCGKGHGSCLPAGGDREIRSQDGESTGFSISAHRFDQASRGGN